MTILFLTFLLDNPEKDQQNLLNKLGYAETKLSEGKTQDAVAKITDIRSAVAKLAARGKLDQDAANDIDVAAADAIACLEGPSSV
jgi:hypothetical protein